MLLEKRGATNYYAAFYGRRALRILPLYFLVVTSFFALLWIIGRGWLLPPDWVADWMFANPLPWWSYLNFTQNFATVYAGGWGAAWLTPAWSLAVEMQFALILPLLIALVSPKRLPYVLLALVLAAPALRAGFAAWLPNLGMAGLLLPSKADSLFLGVLAAWVMRQGGWRKTLKSARGRWGLYATLAVLAGFSAWALMHPPWVPSAVPAPLSAALLDATLAWFFACLLLAVATETRGPTSYLLYPLRKLAPTVYGAFLFHLPMLGVSYWIFYGGGVLSGAYPAVVVKGVAIFATFALGTASWLFLEKRFVRLGHQRFRYEPTSSIREQKRISPTGPNSTRA